MTVLELINSLTNLGEENFNKKVIIFDGPCYCTPTTVEIMGGEWKEHQGCILID